MKFLFALYLYRKCGTFYNRYTAFELFLYLLLNVNNYRFEKERIKKKLKLFGFYRENVLHL